MKYLLLVYMDEREWEKLTPVEQERMRSEGDRFAAELKQSGQFLAGSPLHSVSTATSIRGGSAGQLLITDGPFAETREQLGGYVLIEVKDRDEAIQIGKRFHSGGPAAIEVRPVLETGCGQE